MEVVNIVGSGAIGVEIDLQALAATASVHETRYDPGSHPGLYLRFTEDGPLVTLYRTGKYNITGEDTEDALLAVRDRFLTMLCDLDILETTEDTGFAVQNYVCTGELDGDVNLNALAVHLGLDRTEYEPEQFPALVYRPVEYECVMLVFSTGRVVVTGIAERQVGEEAFLELATEIASVLQ